MTPKTLFPSSSKTPVVQKKAPAEAAGLPLPPVQAPANDPQEPHSPPVLTQVLAASTPAIAAPAGSATETPSETAKELRDRLFAQPAAELSTRQLKLRNNIALIEKFISFKVPKRDHLTEVCDALKDLTKNDDLRKLKNECGDDWVRLFSLKVEDFLRYVSSLQEPRFRWGELSMKQVARICYGLKVYYALNQETGFFSTGQSITLRDAGRRITRKLIDQVHQQHLIQANYQSSGDVLSLLAWIVAGLQFPLKFPNGSQEMLLGGCSKVPGKVSLTDIASSMLTYFGEGRAASMTARQIGKLLNGVTRLITQGVLVATAESEENGSVRKQLQSALVDWCNSPSLALGAEVQVDQPDMDDITYSVVTENLVSGLRRIMQANCLEAGTPETKQIVARSLQWIRSLMSQNTIDLKVLQEFRNYLKVASTFVIAPKSDRQTFEIETKPVLEQYEAVSRAIEAYSS